MRLGARSRTLAAVTKWKFIGVLVILAAAVFIAGAIVVVVLNDTSNSSRTFSGPITKIILTTDRGAITVDGVPGDRISVEVQRHFVAYGPDVTESVSGGVLSVLSNCPMVAFIACSANFTVNAPAGVSIDATAQRGLLTVNNMTGTVYSNAESGDLLLTGPTASVTGYTLDGQLTAHFTAPPRYVHLRSETGNVTVTLPAAAYDIDANSGVGTAKVTGLVSHHGASHSIYASSGSGTALVTANR